jgi:serine/threonine protein kinase
MSEDVHIQLADFGLTGLGDTITTGAATATTEHSTVRWAAPEIHNPEQFGFENFKRTRATDIYAFGGLCVEVRRNHLNDMIPATDKAVSAVYWAQTLFTCPLRHECTIQNCKWRRACAMVTYF